MIDYDKYSAVYDFNTVYDIKNGHYSELDFVHYDKNLESDNYYLKWLNVSEYINTSESPHLFYGYKYRHRLSLSDEYDETISKLVLSDIPFTNPLIYFDTVNKVPMKAIGVSLNLDYGFAINEDIPFGFIYHNNDKGITYNARKYGLTNTGLIDFSKLISEYTTVNDILVVKNHSMEQYNYIALSKDVAGYSAIITQDDLKITGINDIYRNRCPRNMSISKNGEVIHSINIDYDEDGITKSFVMDGKERCLYEKDDDLTSSNHPLVWEPFFEELYKDIIVGDIPYEVNEELLREDDLYINYDRRVYKA